MKIDKKTSYDEKKCISKPKKIWGHFISKEIYPDEIHTFYINSTRPYSKNTLGKDLIITQQRVLKIDFLHPVLKDSWTIYRIEACLPNENWLKASWENEPVPSKNLRQQSPYPLKIR